MVWPPTPLTRTLWPRPATTRRSGCGTRPCMKWCPSPTWKVLCFGVVGGFVGGGGGVLDRNAMLLLSCFRDIFLTFWCFCFLPFLLSLLSLLSFLSRLSLLFFLFFSFSSFLSLLSFLSLFVSKSTLPCGGVVTTGRFDWVGDWVGRGGQGGRRGRKEWRHRVVERRNLGTYLVGCLVSHRGCCWDFVVEENIFWDSYFLNDFDLSVSELSLFFTFSSTFHSIDSFIFFRKLSTKAEIPGNGFMWRNSARTVNYSLWVRKTKKF